jgi:hypothetical protein
MKTSILAATKPVKPESTLLVHLRKLQQMRGASANMSPSLRRVKDWQHQRLALTYADLSADARFAPATAFFLDELYGGKDCALRDRDLVRMVPTMQRLLPAFALETVEKAIALDVISEECDQAMAAATAHLNKLSEATYCAAFRQIGMQAAREHQVVLMQEVGARLDVVVKKSMIYTTLKMLRGPSKLAGMGEIQAFLEAGFTAFRHMQGAEYFLQTIARREATFITRIFADEAKPFRLDGIAVVVR